MREPLSEVEGCDLLARVFRSRGYAIKRDVTFNEHGVRFRIDGWDARSRVGFEFLSSEAHDHDELTLGEFKRLMAAQQRGELAIFVVDESEQLSEADLAAAAKDFLDECAATRGPRRATRRRTTKRKPPAKPATKSVRRVTRKTRPKR
jgi:hypothetical protein